jgi:very-short-patch-repair endonuclease
MDIITAMRRSGGVADHGHLKAVAGRAALDQALRAGSIRRVARGRYVLPDVVDSARVEAHRLTAVVGLRSAAASYGWSLKTPPDRPELVVPRGRKVSAGDQALARVRWQRLAACDVDGWRTTPLRTVMDCATTLPFDEALAVADSALRSGLATQADLMRAADSLPGRGRDAALEVAWFASDRPANAFESVIRAISLDVPGLRLQPQVRLRVAGRRIRPDLVDRELRLVVEGDSHEFHTSERAIDADCWRYDELVLDGWLVIRVSWVQAMFQQDWVVSVLRRAANRQDLTLGGDLMRRRGALRRPTTIGRS